MSVERRKHPRVKVELPARLRVAGAEHVATVKDICRDAALVEADRSWPVGTSVDLEMTLPGTDAPAVVGGRVVREVQAEGGLRGVAILFSDPHPMTTLKIDFLLELQGQTTDRS